MDQHGRVVVAEDRRVSGSEQALAALLGLFTAGPIGAAAALAAIRGVQGKWGTWFLLGVPAAMVINAFCAGLFFGVTVLINRSGQPAQPSSQSQSHSQSPSAPIPAGQAQRPAVAPAAATPRALVFYEAGTAVGGQRVRLDLASLRQGAGPAEIDFVYYLGEERIAAMANCPAGTWVTRPELATHRPQSAATQAMLDRVCQGAAPAGAPPATAVTTAVVFDPPSNIRVTPNGAILCSVTVPQTIAIQGRRGDWYATDHCGRPGFIHAGQVRL